MDGADNSHFEVSRLAFLYDIATGGDIAWEERISRLLAFGASTFGMQIGVLGRITGDIFEVAGVAPAGARISVGDRFPLAETYCQRTLESSRALALNRASGTEWERHPCYRSMGLEAYLGIRITVSGRVWGTLSFSSWRPQPQAFLKSDQQFLALMARWIGQELEREEKSRELRQLSEWQRVILESANYSIIATDPAGLILNFNHAAERMLGYRSDEVVGKHTPALIHDASQVVERAARLSAELGCHVEPGFEVFAARPRRGEREEREWTYIRKDGSRLPVLLSISALKDSDGSIRGYLGIAVDLTLRKQLEERAAIAQAHELSHGLVRAVAEGIICLDPELPYRIRFVNPYAAALLGMEEQEAAGRVLEDVLSIRAESVHGPEGILEKLKPQDATAFEALVCTAGRPEGFPAALTIARAGGLLVLTLQDITLRRQTEQSLRLSGKVFEVCSEAIMITDAAGTIISVNPAFTWLTGYRPDEAIGQTPRLLKSGVHDANFYAKLWIALLSEGTWSGELWDRRKDGSCYPKWASINAVRESGEITHFVAMFHDISEQKNHESRIRHLAEHDALTGLPNRRLLEARVAQLIASERRADHGFALVLIDLDRFKNINDTLGHQVGDQVLIEVARRLAHGVRATDTVARLGGDEFVILLSGVDGLEDLVEVIGKIHRRLGEAIVLDGRALHAPPSMGIAVFPEDGGDIDTLLKHADAAMYQTKARGRNGWTFFTPEMNRHIEERLCLEDALRQALTTGGLSLHFQPQLTVGSASIVSWEALLRWAHPKLGDIPPERIIPIAEETGLIHPLGNWVISTACQEVRRWEDAGLGRFRVSVNVSPLQLEQPGLEETVMAALAAAGLEPGRLELEITESILMSRSPTAMHTLESLRRHGVLITLDDFGTGYSSLTYLKTLAIDRVKIDGSFVRNVTTDRSDASIVQAVVALANNLNLDVVAEGVETAEQHAFLRDHGCSEVQGFLLGHPMPSSAVGEFVERLKSGVCESL